MVHDIRRSATRVHCISRSVQPAWGINSTISLLRPRGDLHINNMRYADHTILMATSEEGLQRILVETNENSELKGLIISCKKMKCMVISMSEPPPACTLKIWDTSIQQVDSFNCFFSSESGTLTAETCNNIQANEMWFYRRMLTYDLLHRQGNQHRGSEPRSTRKRASPTSWMWTELVPRTRNPKGLRVPENEHRKYRNCNFSGNSK